MNKNNAKPNKDKDPEKGLGKSIAFGKRVRVENPDAKPPEEEKDDLRRWIGRVRAEEGNISKQ